MAYLVGCFLVASIAATALGFAGTSSGLVRVATGLFVTTMLFSVGGAVVLYVRNRRRTGSKST